MSRLEDRLPGHTFSLDVDDFFIIDWRGLTAGARRRPADGRWIVVVQDVLTSDGDFDTAPVEERVAADRDHALAEICEIAPIMVRQRES